MPISNIQEGVVVTANNLQVAPKVEFQISSATALAVIKTERAAAGQIAGRLSFETNNGTATSTKMLIDGQGNVGVGTLNPAARLHVVGDLRVDTKLTAESLKVSGTSEVKDLTVTGVLTANVAPGPDSIGNTQLAQDSKSLSKVSGGKLVVAGDNIGLGTPAPEALLHVNGNAKIKNLEVTGTISGVSFPRVLRNILVSRIDPGQTMGINIGPMDVFRNAILTVTAHALEGIDASDPLSISVQETTVQVRPPSGEVVVHATLLNTSRQSIKSFVVFTGATPYQ